MRDECVDRNEQLTAMGFSLTSSQGEGLVEDGWPCVIYRVALFYKERVVIRTDYKMGVWHFSPTQVEADMAAKYWCKWVKGEEAGLVVAWRRKPRTDYTPHLFANAAAAIARHRKKVPELVEVIHSLFMDASGTDASFEEWATEYGLAPDSIRAKKTYDLCCETARALRRGIPPEVRTKVEEIIQDY